MQGPFLAESPASSVAGEVCAACGRTIGQLEQPFVWQENIVCFGCHRDLSQGATVESPDSPAAAPLPERVLHPDARCKITRDRVVLAGHTYSRSEIRSARLQALPPRRAYAVTLALAGLALVLVGLNRHLDRLDSTLLIVGSGLFAVGAVVAMLLRTKYTVLLLVNEREFPAFRCSKRISAHRVLDAIGEAIVERGQFSAAVQPEHRPELDD